MKYITRIGLIAAMLFLGLTAAKAQTDTSGETSDWLKRVDFGIKGGTEEKPTYYFQTVQPLYESDNEASTLFVQPRAATSGDTEIYNLGLGYRDLNSEETRLYGINTFYDYSAEHNHYRLGVGLEALGKVLESRLNTYWGLSDKRIVAESSTFTTYEEVVNGFDVELGGPFIPHVPWIKLYGSGSWYDYKHGDDSEGWKLRGRLQPMEITSFDVILWDDNKGDPEVQLDGRITIAFDTWGDILDSLKLNEEAYEDRDLKKEMLEPVERDYNVKVETWMETASATVEVRRGD